MKNLLCCVLAASFFLVQADKESIRRASFKTFEEHFKNGAHNPEFDHLAILGSRKAEEEFDELEPEQSKERLAKLIPKMDLNKDGRLCLPEIQSWVFNSYKSLDNEEAKDEFKNSDTDGNNMVTWDEYLKKVYSYTSKDFDEIKKRSEEELKAIERMIDEDKEKFHVADLNKDGALTIEEFPAFVHPHDYEYMHPLEIKNALKDHDKNKNGKIELSEYRTESSQNDQTEKLAEEEKFKDYDVNKDGVLDTTEMKAWILPNTMQNAKEEAEHLVQEADLDHDQLLTEKEILESYETFVGSQATDYGRHLHLVHQEL